MASVVWREALHGAQEASNLLCPSIASTVMATPGTDSRPWSSGRSGGQRGEGGRCSYNQHVASWLGAKRCFTWTAR